MPALPYEVSRPGSRRSTSTTEWPRMRRCKAVQVPTMPAPSTRICRLIAAGRDHRELQQGARQHEVGAHRGAHRARLGEGVGKDPVERREVRRVHQVGGDGHHIGQRQPWARRVASMRRSVSAVCTSMPAGIEPSPRGEGHPRETPGRQKARVFENGKARGGP